MITPRRPSLHRAHRQQLLDALGEGQAVLIFAAPQATRSNDTEYRYRPDSDLWYLTGWEQPEAALLLRKGADQPTLLFVQARNPEREIWEGRRPGPEGAVRDYGVDAAFPYDELGPKLPDLLMGYRDLHYAIARDPLHDQLVAGAIRASRKKARKHGLETPSAFIDPSRLLHELRLHKSPEELEIMRRAAEITAEAHVAAMAMTAPGLRELELEAEIERIFRVRGGNGPGYTTIVGGGDNATILHYIENDAALQDGDLVCVDAGCEFDYYTADVTRTWPVNGRFSAAQKELYELVLEAELACIERVRPGVTHKQIHDLAVEILTRGMVRLGLLSYDREAELAWAEAQGEELPEELPADASPEELVARLVETERYKRYYMHGTGHWLGIDVHDVGAYVALGDSRACAPGMVTTIEPGLYIPRDDDKAPERFRGIGIRVEDDVLCTEGAPEVLTASIPKGIAEIEALVGTAVRAASRFDAYKNEVLDKEGEG